MQGVGIFNGGLLIVGRSLTAKKGDIIVANYNGCFVCKLIDKTQALLLARLDCIIRTMSINQYLTITYGYTYNRVLI